MWERVMSKVQVCRTRKETREVSFRDGNSVLLCPLQTPRQTPPQLCEKLNTDTDSSMQICQLHTCQECTWVADWTTKIFQMVPFRFDDRGSVQKDACSVIQVAPYACDIICWTQFDQECSVFFTF